MYTNTNSEASCINSLELALKEKNSRIHALESSLAEEKTSKIKLMNDLSEEKISNTKLIKDLTEQILSNAKLLNDLSEEKTSNTKLMNDYSIILKTQSKIKQIISGNITLIPFEIILRNKDYDKLLLYKDFDIERHFEQIHTFLINSKNNHLIKHIIDNCLNINAEVSLSGYSSKRLIHLIIKHTNDEMIKYIFEKENIDLDCMDQNDKYPIHLVCQISSSTIIIKKIIDKHIHSSLTFGDAFTFKRALIHSINHNLCLNTYQKSELINLIKNK